VGKTLLIAGLCSLVPLGGNVVASFLTVWTGGRSWLVVPVVGVCVAMLTALIQAFGSAPRPASRPQPAGGQWPGEEYPYRRYGPPERRGLPLPAVLLIALVVIGGGGWALAQGVRYGVGYVTGNESGTEQLLRPVTGHAGDLALTVESVQRTAHFTRVRVVARNDAGITVTLPLFGNCVLVGSDHTTLQAESFKSRWSDSLSPGSQQRGTITFGGHLPASVRQAELRFSTLFWQGFGQPRSIAVTGIALAPG
jgi:hypothetical protein